jgi:hypothetical protein
MPESERAAELVDDETRVMTSSRPAPSSGGNAKSSMFK